MLCIKLFSLQGIKFSFILRVVIMQTQSKYLLTFTVSFPPHLRKRHTLIKLPLKNVCYTKLVFWHYLPNLKCSIAVNPEWNPQFAQTEMSRVYTKYCMIHIPVVEPQWTPAVWGFTWSVQSCLVIGTTF